MLDAPNPLSPSATEPHRDDEHASLIDASWDRSRRFGLERRETPDFHALTRSDLRLLREQHGELMMHAAPVMETLHQQIVDTDSMVALTDAHGVVLHSIGDASFEPHCAEARALGIEPCILRLPGLGLDIDTPSDLAALRAMAPLPAATTVTAP